MKLLSDQQKTKGYIKNRILGFVLSTILSVVLYHFYFQLLNISYSLTDIVIPIVLFNLIWVILGYFKRIILMILPMIVLGFVFYYWQLPEPEKIKLIDWIMSIVTNIQQTIQWTFLLNSYKGGEPQLFRVLFVVSITFVSNFLVWILSSPLLILLILVLPQFFILEISTTPYYLLFLLSGLMIVSSVYSLNKKETFVYPNFVVIGLILLSTVLVSQQLSPYFFYNQTLNERYFQSNNGIGNNININGTPFNLSQVGYSQSNTRIGGSVTLSNTPFMLVDGPLETFYLKGSSYVDFKDLTWIYNKVGNTFEYTNDHSSFEQQITFNQSNSALIKSTVIRINPIQFTESIFYTGYPKSIVLDTQAPIYFDIYGQLISDRNRLEDGYNVEIVYLPNSSRLDLVTSGDYRPLSKNNDILQQKQGPRQFENQIKDLDEALYQLTYVQPFDNELERAFAIQNYFQNTAFTYSLNVKDFPNNDFFSHFLDIRSGYCVHFASATTLLLQDIGFNARYTEGFVIPESQQTTRLISSNLAHAWTEIYVQDIGWVIIDGTPSSFLDVLQPTTPNEPIEPEPIDPVDPKPIEPTPPNPTDPTNPIDPILEKDATWLVWVLVVVSVIGYLILRWFQFKRRHNEVYLRQKYSQQALIQHIYFEMIDIYRIDGYVLKPSNSVTQNYNRMSKTYEFSQISRCLELLERAFYAKEIKDTYLITPLLTNYQTMEDTLKQKKPLVWFFTRFLI